MGRSKDSVQIDKYALANAMLANETSSQEVSVMLGHAKNYMAQVVSGGGWMKRRDYDNLKGLLRVTDNDIIKAVPVQRGEEVESIYQPVPVKKLRGISLDKDNEEFVETLKMFCGREWGEIVNAIVTDFREKSRVGTVIAAARNAANGLVGETPAEESSLPF